MSRRCAVVSRLLASILHHRCLALSARNQWDKIEHRLFSFISINWRGAPLVNYETVAALIGGTCTRSGLQVKALIDTREYETGTTVFDEQVRDLHLRGHSFHPDWNYAMLPAVPQRKRIK